MKLSVWDVIKDQRKPVPALGKADLKGKTIIVIGANIGLGLESAKHFARMGPGKLIVTCRNKEKGDETVAQITKDTGFQNVEAYVLDLGDLSSVKAFIKRFETEGGGRLDILLENAAVSLPNLEFTKDGWETSFQVNNLSNSLIALSLLPCMLETAEKYNTTPRIVVVTSELHYWAKFPKKDLDSPGNFFRKWGHKENLKKFAGFRYGETKLLNVLFVRALDARLHRKPLIVNAPNPGLCASSLSRNQKFPTNLIMRLMIMTLARTVEQGGRLLASAAVGDEERKDQLRGAFLSLAKVQEPADTVVGDKGKQLQDKLWDDLIEELVLIEPKIQQIVKDYLTEPSY